MSFIPHDFLLETNGKSIDKDGAYGAQCWDLWAHFTDKCGYPRFNCTQSGYVKDIANLKHQSGLLNYFDEVALGQQQDGDWFVWDFGNISHIAMFRLDNGNGTGIFLGQNQGVPYVNQVNYSYANVIGIFRPKIWVKPAPEVVTPTAPSPEQTAPQTKYKVGDVVTLSTYYSNSNATPDKAHYPTKWKTGTITKVLSNGALNPYLLDDGFCWFNEGDVRELVNSIPSTPSFKTHTVVKGDTLWDISVKYNTTVDKLVSDNNIANKNQISVGQVLIIK